MFQAFESSRVLRCSDSLSLILSLRIGPTSLDGVIRLEISSLRTILSARENFLTPFELYHVLSVRICNS